MGQCKTCNNFFPPKLMIVVDEGLNHQQCVFCKAGKEYITIVDEKTGKEEVITKSYVIDEYKKYISELRNSEKIKNVINPSNIIKPY